MKRLFLKRTALLFVAMLAAGQLSAEILNIPTDGGSPISTEKIDGWSINNSSKFEVNTWSGEGNSDGSGMTTPFLQNWVYRDSKLPSGTWSYTVTGLVANTTYTMSALVRAYNEGSSINPSGVKIYAGSGTSADISTGTLIDKDGNRGRYATLTATGTSNSNGELVIGVKVEANKSNWVALKNVAIVRGWSINSSSTFHVNTWSTEGNSDGSGMTTPFLENWVSSGNTLPAGTWSYTVTGLSANKEYTMQALVRAYNTDSEKDPSGVTIYAGSGTSADISTGTEIPYTYRDTIVKSSADEDSTIQIGNPNAGRYAILTAKGTSNSKGELTIGVKVTAGKVNWVAMKDVIVWRLEGYVDLGLPSGTLWADCNVGASSPLESGNYYAWAETSAKENYDWSTYTYRIESGSRNLLTKYCVDGNYGTADGVTELEGSDDAASVNRGTHWQMPDSAQFAELINEGYTTCVWKRFGSVTGLLIKSKTNGNSIFLPAVGREVSADTIDSGMGGYYWSRSLYSNDYNSAGEETSGNSYGARALFFGSDDVNIYNFSRCHGLLVRPVYVP
ncbi:MAG: hypothetical protein E7070_01100 [Bacteroidales bacterium]|nr:hypothetical protein [Bacteroidales bacterium]